MRLNRLGFSGFAVTFLAFIVLAVAIGSPSRAGAQVVINEIIAANARSIVDDDEESSDWVELYNAGARPVDLTNYGLSDRVRGSEPWIFPQVVLEPDDYLLVWCSGKDRVLIPEPGRIVPRRGESPFPFSAGLVSPNAEWRYLVGMPQEVDPPPGWNTVPFDDAAWQVGSPAFGFGDDRTRTVLPQSPRAVFLRHKFRPKSPG